MRPENPRSAILSIGEDYFEGKGHFLYVMDGKLRLHITFRYSDLAMRVESADPLRIGEWQHVLVTYDGGMRAAGVHMYVDGREVGLKILFDYAIWPIETKEPLRIGAGGGLRFQGDIADVRIYKRALSTEEAAIVAMNDPARRADTRLAFFDLSPPPGYAAARDSCIAGERPRKLLAASRPSWWSRSCRMPRYFC
jgi:hypothetical protein